MFFFCQEPKNKKFSNTFYFLFLSNDILTP
uniref:Uncharacterized protein n=1 Tax=viral metagenome TaxID=1070528 RepID=A0A6C0K2Z2_9ZZZZ